MRNIKIEKGFVGSEYWLSVPYVDIKGAAEAVEYPKGATEAEKEAAIQSWKSVAVLKVTPKVTVKFGFITDGASQYLKEGIELDENGQFAVRIGKDSVRFFVLPSSLDQNLTLELVETTSENDPKYKDLPLY